MPDTAANRVRDRSAPTSKYNAVTPAAARVITSEPESASVLHEAVSNEVSIKTSKTDSPVDPSPSASTAIDEVKEVIAERAVTTTEPEEPVEAETDFASPAETAETAVVRTATTSVSVTETPTDDIAAVVDKDESNATPENMPKSKPLPVAEDVDLSEPVIVSNESEPPVGPSSGESIEVMPSPDEVKAKSPMVLLGEEVAPGTSARLSWSPDQHFDGISVPTPVLVVNGTQPGMTVCLTAAVHGDELNGIEIVRRVVYDLNPKELSGAVIGVPIVNLQGFRRNSRYLPDRRDLNRFFPGNSSGSSASRMANSFFTQVIRHCDALVDIHTGSFLRTNLPQLRADMSVPEVAELTEGFGATAVLHSSSTGGTLRRAAVLAGIPAVTLETGEPSRLQEDEIEHGTKGIQTLLTKLKMTRSIRVWGDPQPVYYKSVWVRADDGGLLFTSVELGQRVGKGQVLGTVTDPITNVRTELISPLKGRVLGMALNQVVLPGFATFRIGVPSKQKEVVTSPEAPPNGTPEKVSPDVPESIPTDVDIEDENS
ncbi:MAG: succinylglutamate desuccinylase/aspartoacylase family protein [Gammaproteobacteria bacterium]